MLVYTPHKSPRLSFVLHHLSERFFLEEIIDTNNKILFEKDRGIKINYSAELIESNQQIIPEGLLFEKSIRSYENDFFSNDIDYRQQQDIFSIIFYNLSRYEEYQIKERDEHGRFSFAYLNKKKTSLIEKPFLDSLIINWINSLEKEFNRNLLKQLDFSFHCTFDIDVAYAYKGRGQLRSFGSIVKNRLKGKSELNKERQSVLKGEMKDPFDTFDFLQSLVKKHKLSAKYFFLMAQKGKFDHGLHPDSEELQALINEVSEYAQIGIHPSYQSHSHFKILEKERNSLERITGDICAISRQHFLKFDLPETYRNLIKLGIKEDFSLGYSKAPLFRAGTCFPFHWFDLKMNCSTDLVLYPLSWMESTFIYNRDYTFIEAEESLFKIIESVKAVNGHFVSLWHNNHLCDNQEFKSWRSLFQKMVEHCVNS